MPNSYGDGQQANSLYYSVAESVILYAALICARALMYQHNVKLLQSTQKTALLRVARAYSSVSFDSLRILTGHPLIDMIAQEREKILPGSDGP